MKTVRLSIIFWLSITPFFVSAQAPCGDFVLVEEYEGGVYEERTPIEDCENPLGGDIPAPYVPTLTIQGDHVSSGDTLEVVEGETVSVVGHIPADPDYIALRLDLYIASGTDYYFVGSDSDVDSSDISFAAALSPGEYTAIFSRSPRPELVKNKSWYEPFLRIFMPATAYAYHVNESDEIVVIRFSVVNEVEPLGASSVLFLPGIMGSRLYETGDFCGNTGEQELWLSFDDCKQLRMKTDFRGISLNTVYTKSTTESVIDSVSISPLYADWVETLEEWKENESISDYAAVPYDWRLSLTDIFKTRERDGKIVYDAAATYKDSYIYKSLERLAQASDSGKVTLIAHSNGGLVAKTLINEMKAHNDPLLNSIERLMLIAVPQTGTPDAITSILHGSELGYGLISDKKTSRSLTNTAPFAHHLLPSEAYVSEVGASVSSAMIEFSPGASTDTWRSEYGDTINTITELHSFLANTSGRPKPAFEDVLTPEVVDPFLLNYANTVHVAQANFTPPSSMEVIQVGGIGSPTKESITYFTNSECVSRFLSFFHCKEYRDKLGYRINTTVHGDGTVVLPSALSMPEAENVKRVWVNLLQYNNDVTFGRVHRNIMEIPQLQDFVGAVITNRPYADNEYVTTQQVTIIPQDRLIYQLHSPLDMVLISDEGEVSSTTNTLRGAVYERVGEVQYISIPTNTRNPQLKLFGYASGSFTLDVETWSNNAMTERVTFSAIPTAPSTIVTLLQDRNIASSTLLLDLEGDGNNEATATTQLVILLEVTENENQRKANGGTRVAGIPLGVVAGIATSSESYREQLQIIIQLLEGVLLLMQIIYEN